MKRTILPTFVALTLWFAVQPGPRAQQPSTATTVGALSINVTNDSSIREWDAQIDRWIRAGDLRRQRVTADTLLAGRTHERLQQNYQGIPVFGAEMTRQMDGAITVSVFGTFHVGIDLDPTPRLSPEQAKDAVQRLASADAVVEGVPTLIVFPATGRGYTLCYRATVIRAGDELEYFIDANTSAEVFRYSNLKRQAAVGRGTGVLGDTKKISATQTAGAFFADDRLRPPAIFTFDMRGDPIRTEEFLLGRRSLSAADLAVDTDNNWGDGAAVDAHVYAGWVYDYYFKRFGRRGLDDRNLPIVSLVHPVRREAFVTLGRELPQFFGNAFWSPSRRVMVYGVGRPAGVTPQTWNFVSGALDIVAHELTHGLTQFSSDLDYFNESGALNEAFSDMLGTGAEFFFQAPGAGPLRADYLLGEDVVTPGGIRSMQDPTQFDQPDHYSLRTYIGATSETFDNGGVHVNSGIANQAFYFAIEGGRNRVSGRIVQGVGPGNREQIERVFYRAFTTMLPRNATFYQARTTTIQSARDLYGSGSAAERAVTQAWDAVGVTSPGAALTTRFTPNPAPDDPLRCPGPLPRFFSQIVAAEFQNVGFFVERFDALFFDAALTQTSTQSGTGEDFRRLFGFSTNRIPGNTSSRSAGVCISIGGRSGGYFLFRYVGTDDNGNRGTFVSDYLALGGARRLPVREEQHDDSFTISPATKP